MKAAYYLVSVLLLSSTCLAVPKVTVFYYNTDITKTLPNGRVEYSVRRFSTLEEALKFVSPSGEGSAQSPMSLRVQPDIGFFAELGFSTVTRALPQNMETSSALISTDVHIESPRGRRVFMSFGSDFQDAGHAEVLRRILTEGEGEYVLFIDPGRHDADRQSIFNVQTKKFENLKSFVESSSIQSFKLKSIALKIYLKIAPARMRFKVLQYCASRLENM